MFVHSRVPDTPEIRLAQLLDISAGIKVTNGRLLFENLVRKYVQNFETKTRLSRNELSNLETLKCWKRARIYKLNETGNDQKINFLFQIHAERTRENMQILSLFDVIPVDNLFNEMCNIVTAYNDEVW